MVAFDTLQIAKELEAAFTPEQAQALVRAFAHTLTQDLATKQDLAELEARLKSEIQDVRAEIQDVRAEIQDVRVEIRDLKVDMVKWIVGAIAFNMLGTAGLIIYLIKAIPR